MLLSDAKVLLIEDHPEALALLTELLEGYFREICPVSSAEEGLDIYRESAPDLLISDISLPGLDGVGLAERIRAEDEKIPIFWLSAHNDTRLHHEAARLKIDGVFAKPLIDLVGFLGSLEHAAKGLPVPGIEE
ncbi:response regulator [Nitratifractor salsuginis]|uniref:Response regulator receiver protein n=1 Tax=Nitratifractor salsuginis (strain DSM 16511 / JCM 12458 / E9I37-1) TaxID=749222 RepID=E6WXR8_NITSE|nr:response regulator [Nitratifractor salsuginis]ADV46325.1 response regulator receiver protein [Nitratifractor salsuginis DSM 16511]